MEIGINYDVLPESMASNLDKVNLVDWNMQFVDLVHELPEVKSQTNKYTVGDLRDVASSSEKCGEFFGRAFAEDDTGCLVLGHTVTAEKILEKFPVLLIEPALCSLIEDTVPSIEGLKLPYIGFFINQRFELRNGSIMGIFVADRRKFFHFNAMDHGLTTEQADMLTASMLGTCGADFQNSGIVFTAVFLGNDKKTLSIYIFDMKEATEKLKDMPRERADITQRILFYGANVANLIMSHVNLNDPLDSKREMRIVPDRKHLKTAKYKRDYSVIRVFKDFKNYTESYHHARKRSQSTDSVFVRGHWRYLRSPRYKNKRFQLIFIPPYIKGLAEDLRSRLIKLQM